MSCGINKSSNRKKLVLTSPNKRQSLGEVHSRTKDKEFLCINNRIFDIFGQSINRTSRGTHKPDKKGLVTGSLNDEGWGEIECLGTTFFNETPHITVIVLFPNHNIYSGSIQLQQ
jgi:hypothetical protein